MSGIRFHIRRASWPRLVVGLTLVLSLSLLSLIGVRSLALASVRSPASMRSAASVRSAAAANPCGPPVTSVIACENTLPGDPTSDWQVTGAGDPTIQGFATSISVDVGQTVYFKINTPAT